MLDHLSGWKDWTGFSASFDLQRPLHVHGDDSNTDIKFNSNILIDYSIEIQPGGQLNDRICKTNLVTFLTECVGNDTPQIVNCLDVNLSSSGVHLPASYVPTISSPLIYI